MIYFDVTKTGRAGHASGLNRVSARLREELGAAVVLVEWQARRREFRNVPSGRPVGWRPEDWFFTGELFCETERPGLGAWLQTRPCRFAALFHDAIPMKFPSITWPQSVARHPGYLTLLADFDRVLAVSDASKMELTDFWRWQGRSARAVTGRLHLGADFNRQSRRRSTTPPPDPALLCVGILEPRKNQLFLLDVCEALWAAGAKFTLHLAGRVNPHFGAPVVAKVKALRQAGRPVRHHEGIGDAALAQLYASARATVCPTLAEGCGLPLLESLWEGVPCVCSDLPVLRENADGGGCVPVALTDAAAWSGALRRVLTDDASWRALADQAASRNLPTWAESARALQAALA